jgi:hypothetical protein
MPLQATCAETKAACDPCYYCARSGLSYLDWAVEWNFFFADHPQLGKNQRS